MQTEAEPALAALRQSGFLPAVDGTPLYWESYTPCSPQGVVVVLHGFTGSIEKLYEPIYDMVCHGFAVYAPELRGHGHSGRAVPNPYAVHADRFEDYPDDLERFCAEIVLPRAGGMPLSLYAHSLGGGIGAWVLERDPSLFRRAVLTSPMISPRAPKGIPSAAAAQSLCRLFGPTHLPLPSSGFHPVGGKKVASSEARGHYYRRKQEREPLYQTVLPTCGWLREAFRARELLLGGAMPEQITADLLLCRTEHDRLVDTAAQDLFAARVPSCRLLSFSGVGHELYNTPDPVYRTYIGQVLRFLGGL